MEETPVTEAPKKRKERRDKGQKRGSRVKAPPVVTRPVPRILPDGDEPPPVKVIVDGEEIRCNAWTFEGGFLKLSYWPENRGREGTRYIAIAGIKDLRVEWPRGMQQPVNVPAHTIPRLPYPGVVTFGPNASEAPTDYINPIAAARRERGVLPIVPVKDPTGLRPMTQIADNEGKVEIVGATIS